MNRKEANELVARQNQDSPETTLLIKRKNRNGYYIAHGVEIDRSTNQTWILVHPVRISTNDFQPTIYGTGRMLAAQAETCGTMSQAIHTAKRHQELVQGREELIEEIFGTTSNSTDMWASQRRVTRHVLEILGLDDTTATSINTYGAGEMNISLTMAQVLTLLKG